MFVVVPVDCHNHSCLCDMSTADSASPDPVDWEQSSEHHLCGLRQEGQGTTSAEMGTRVSLLLCSHQCKHWNCQLSSRIPFHKAGYINLLKKKKEKKGTTHFTEHSNKFKERGKKARGDVGSDGRGMGFVMKLHLSLSHIYICNALLKMYQDQ